jgi:hypothetical protein
VAEENSAEKIARLEREIETLKKENERLRGLLEEALRQDGSRTGTSFRIAGESGRAVPGHGTGGAKGGTSL